MKLNFSEVMTFFLFVFAIYYFFNHSQTLISPTHPTPAPFAPNSDFSQNSTDPEVYAQKMFIICDTYSDEPGRIWIQTTGSAKVLERRYKTVDWATNRESQTMFLIGYNVGAKIGMSKGNSYDQNNSCIFDTSLEGTGELPFKLTPDDPAQDQFLMSLLRDIKGNLEVIQFSEDTSGHFTIEPRGSGSFAESFTYWNTFQAY